MHGRGVTVVVAEKYTVFGQIVLIFLMQIGGLGLMTFLAIFILMSKKHLYFAEKKLVQNALNKAMCKGEFSFPLKNLCYLPRGNYCDFHGINYYTRTCVSGLKDGVCSNVPVNDLGWEIYPQGLIECAEKLDSFIRRPIYITENGTCDNEDQFRSRYIYDHIKEITQSNLPIERYYHWSFMDNFEWSEGESSRFGLVHVNYDTQERMIKKSGEFYSEIIKNNGISEEMYDQYVDGICYPRNKE